MTIDNCQVITNDQYPIAKSQNTKPGVGFKTMV